MACKKYYLSEGDMMDAVCIRIADMNDAEIISKHEQHMTKAVIKDKISRNEIFVAYDDNAFIGWLRYGLLYDIVPFMYMLEMLPEYRNKGLGKRLVLFWEDSMHEQGHRMVMTSTQQNEDAQHFYNVLGYAAVGGFIQTYDAVTEDSYEIILSKKLEGK